MVGSCQSTRGRAADWHVQRAADVHGDYVSGAVSKTGLKCDLSVSSSIIIAIKRATIG